jgi:5-methyltetrahydropteroyltriglutamate--homocysteine methyltransferase
MKRSTDRILTTHAGSLPRPEALIGAYRAGEGTLRGDETQAQLRSAVAEVVAMQARCGVDVVNDGEYGKPMTDEVDYGAWATYVFRRLSGFEMREPQTRGQVLKMILGESKDRRDFASFYAADMAASGAGRRILAFPVNTGPIAYTGRELIERDIASFKAALSGIDVADAFLTAVFTGIQFGKSEYYRSEEEQAVALAEAMRAEYRAIVDAGLNVQIDDPLLVNVYEMHYSISGDLAGFRRWAEGHIELLNHALAGIPEDRVRYHLCWGSWIGPHSTDLPISEVADLVVKINASQYSFEAANPQHEHEWKVWKSVKLPEGRALIPGVVTHKTTILEHPETIADRIVRYASVVGRQNVVAGTDCGFGGRIHPDVAWAKLKALAAGAELASRELWTPARRATGR